MPGLSAAVSMLNPDFRDILSALNADLMTSIEGVEFDDAWAERVSFRIDEIDVPTISLRHLIINKKATGRPQDIADASRLSAS